MYMYVFDITGKHANQSYVPNCELDNIAIPVVEIATSVWGIGGVGTYLQENGA